MTRTARQMCPCAAALVLPSILFSISALLCGVDVCAADKVCSSGTYLRYENTCSTCIPGRYMDIPNNQAILCKTCAPGYYAEKWGQVVCSPCPPGKANPSSHSMFASACVECPAGKSASKGAGECSECSAGTFTLARTGARFCEPCRPGMYGLKSGQTSPEDACQNCPKGRYGNSEGLSYACDDCPAGTYSSGEKLTTMAQCVHCSLGKYSQSKGNIQESTCKQCGLGFHGPSTGLSSCLVCPAGRYMDEVGSYAADCTKCAAGRSSATNASLCQVCTPGTFAAERASTSCKGCDKGRYTENPGSTNCTACPEGTNLLDTSGLPFLHNDVSKCTACPVRSYNPIPGLGLPCFPCQTNVNETGATFCDGCDPGKFKLAGPMGGCQNCEIGTHSDAMDLPACRNCPTGWFAESSVPPFIHCAACPRGMWGSREGAPSSDEGCALCAAGRFSEIPGLDPNGLSPACEACAKGRWTNRTGVSSETHCKHCGSGRYSTTFGAHDVSFCKACSPGAYSSDVGASSASVCRQCPLGFSQRHAGSAYCLPCMSGMFQNLSGSPLCHFCEPGFFRNEDADYDEVTDLSTTQHEKKGCRACPTGYGQPRKGASLCEQCAPGRTAGGLASVVCKECTVGRFTDYMGSNNTLCKVAPRGKYVSAGATALIDVPDGFRVVNCVIDPNTLGASGCRDAGACPAGTIGTNPPSAVCIDCPPGKMSSKGSVRCVACDAGRYANVSGTVTCKMCDMGYFQPNAGAETCIRCSKGMVTTEKGAKTCTELVDKSLPPPTLHSLRPVGLHSKDMLLRFRILREKKERGTDDKTSLIPDVAESILVEWSSDKSFGSNAPDSENDGAIENIEIDLAEIHNALVDKNTTWSMIITPRSKDFLMWRRPLYLRATFLKRNGQKGIYTQDRVDSVVASRCLEMDGVKYYLRTHPNDNTCKEALDLLSISSDGPHCLPCPNGGSCSSPDFGLMVWEIATLEGYWRIPWMPPSEPPSFVKCHNREACLGVGPRDQFIELKSNTSSNGSLEEAVSVDIHPRGAWPNMDENKALNLKNWTCPMARNPPRCREGHEGPRCATCKPKYSLINGMCQPCLPVADRTVYVSLVFCVFLGLVYVGVKFVRKLKGDVRYALRDINRIILILVSLSQINVTLPSVILIEWPEDVKEFMAHFEWVNIDLVSLTGATCEAYVDFQVTILAMSSVPILIVVLALLSYAKGKAMIMTNIERIKKGTKEIRDRELLRCYVELFHVVDCDKSDRISAPEFVDLLKLVGYGMFTQNLNTETGLRIIRKLAGNSEYATELSLRRFIESMQSGTLTPIADKELGIDAAMSAARQKRRSSGSADIDRILAQDDGISEVVDGAVAVTEAKTKFELGNKSKRKRPHRRMTILHDSRLTLVAWNLHRKLVAESFSWAVQLLMLIHTPLSRKIFQYLDCDKIGEGEWARWYVRSDYSLPCSDPADNSRYHARYIAFMPLIIIVMCAFTILLPGSIGCYLFLRRKELYNPTVMSRIGWLYERMNRGSEAWEVIELSRKLILTSIIVFFPQDPTIRCCLALTVCIVAQVMLSLYRPHRSRLVFLTAQFGYGMALVSYLSASMLQSSTLAEDSKVTIGILFITLQILFVVFGLTGVCASLFLIRRRFHRRGLFAETAEEEVSRDQQRRRSSSERLLAGSVSGGGDSSGSSSYRTNGVLKSKDTEKRNSMDKLLSRVQKRDSRTDIVRRVTAIIKRHSAAMRQKTKELTIRHAKSKERLAKRRMSRVSPKAKERGGSPEIVDTAIESAEEKVYMSRVNSFGLPPGLKYKQQSLAMRDKLTKTLSGMQGHSGVSASPHTHST